MVSRIISRSIQWYVSTHESFYKRIQRKYKRIYEKHWRFSTSFWYLPSEAWDWSGMWVKGGEAAPFHSSLCQMQLQVSGGTRHDYVCVKLRSHSHLESTLFFMCILVSWLITQRACMHGKWILCDSIVMSVIQRAWISSEKSTWSWQYGWRFKL